MFGLQQMLNSREVTKNMGELRKVRVILIMSVYANLFQCQSSVSGDKSALSLLLGTSGYIFTEKNLCSIFRQIRGGQRTFHTSADFPLPSAESSPYAKEACLEWHTLIPFMVLNTLL